MRKILDRVYIVCQGVRQAEACQLRIVRKKVKRNLSAINDAQFLQRSNWWQSSVSVGDDSTEGETEGIVATSGSTAQPARMNAISSEIREITILRILRILYFPRSRALSFFEKVKNRKQNNGTD